MHHRAANQLHPTRRRASTRQSLLRRGFSAIDLLVSIAVIALLISIMLPSITRVNESAKRVACQSNLRQIGIGTLMYAQTYDGFLPPSIFLRTVVSPGAMPTPPKPQEMIALRIDQPTPVSGRWDGLGMLYLGDFLDAPEIFYCPSHKGEHTAQRYAREWGTPQDARNASEIIGNYHYRGQAPKVIGRAVNGHAPFIMTSNLFEIDPKSVSLIADGMRVRTDVNHLSGANYFRADMTVQWFADSDRRIARSLPTSKEDATPEPVQSVWQLFDEPTHDEDDDR